MIPFCSDVRGGSHIRVIEESSASSAIMYCGGPVGAAKKDSAYYSSFLYGILTCS